MKKLTAIGIDLGGTRIKAVAIDRDGKILEQFYRDTRDGDSRIWKQSVKDAFDELKVRCGDSRIVTGISAPGIPDAENRSISFMPGRLQGLEGFIWQDFLNGQAWVMNDAIAAMSAEARFGSAVGVDHAIMLTLGTGVGGAILINGRIYQGAFQKAGHLGHLSVNHDGEQDITNIPGSIEDAIGNCTIKKRTLGRYESTHELLAAYRNRDSFAAWVWLNSVQKLAVSIAALTNILSPSMVILGGGITAAGDDLFTPLEDFLSLYEWRAGGNRTRIVKAQFGDMAGAIGAAGFALQLYEDLNPIKQHP